jgi:glycosyltransferase involved in cell wall biosynthesis
LKAIKPVVIVGLEFRLDCIIGGLWARLNNRGYVTWSDMTAYHDIRMGFIRRTNRKFMLSLSHAVIGSCTDTINHFVDNFGSLKENSFLSILSAHVKEHINVKKNTNLHGNRIHFLYVGELIPRKGVDLLIRAFARLLESVPSALLTLVGKGIDSESLQLLANSLNCESSIVFKGSIPYELISHEMIKHDIFVLPTRLDVFGLVVAEAVACGLPVICSRYAGAANDLVRDNGLVVDPENIDELASAMRKLALNPEMRIRMIKEGELILKKNDLRSAVQGYADAIRMALRSTKQD